MGYETINHQWFHIGSNNFSFPNIDSKHIGFQRWPYRLVREEVSHCPGGQCLVSPLKSTYNMWLMINDEAGACLSGNFTKISDFAGWCGIIFFATVDHDNNYICLLFCLDHLGS